MFKRILGVFFALTAFSGCRTEAIVSLLTQSSNTGTTNSGSSVSTTTPPTPITQSLGTILGVQKYFNQNTGGILSVPVSVDPDGKVCAAATNGSNSSTIFRFFSGDFSQPLRTDISNVLISKTAMDLSGNCYVLGTDTANSGDIFFSKIRPGGDTPFHNALRITGVETVADLVFDPNGFLYALGTTTSTSGLFGTGGGDVDVFLIKYSLDGAVIWTRRISAVTTQNINLFAGGVAVDPFGNVYVSGGTAASTNASIIAGYTQGPNEEGFVVQFSPAGLRTWARQVGAPGGDVRFRDIVVDSDFAVYAVGETRGNLVGVSGFPKSNTDAALVSFDLWGNLRWQKQFGVVPSTSTIFFGAAVDRFGGVYVTGRAGGGNWLTGLTTSTHFDVIVGKFDRDGTRLWGIQDGSDSNDAGTSIAVDAYQRVYVTGLTSGPYGGIDSVTNAAFLLRIQ